MPTGFFFTMVGLILVGMGVFCAVRTGGADGFQRESLLRPRDAGVRPLHAGSQPVVETRRLMIAAFRERFGPTQQPRVFRAPGRVNLIGEHTDYNLGFVLPVALDLATYIAAAPSADGKLRIYSEDRQELREFDAVAASASVQPTREWTDYPVGVAQELVRAGVPIDGANLLIRSTVPEGSGLSSSAALEVSSALALLDGREFDPLELAKLCQRAERNFVGMPCGIMDQYISVFGRAHSAVEIDCRSLGHRLVKLPEGITFIAVNTMVKHALSGSAYRDRVRECAAAVEGIAAVYPDVQSLRDVSPEQFEGVASRLPEVVARRARHVVTEDARVNRFVEASRAGRRDRHGQADGGIAPQPAARLRSELRGAGFPGGRGASQSMASTGRA